MKRMILFTLLSSIAFNKKQTVTETVCKIDAPIFEFTGKIAQPIHNPFSNKQQQEYDTAALKKTLWFSDVVKNVEEESYKILENKLTNTYTSANKKNKVSANYSATGFAVCSKSKNLKNWELCLNILGVYGNNTILYTPEKEAVVNHSNKKIAFTYKNNFTTEYINSKEGIRQNFIIHQKPLTATEELSVKLKANKGWHINQVHPKEIHFAKQEHDELKNKLIYNSLKVWDANGKELAANFEVDGLTVSINVNVENALYPVTIDPLSSTANTILDDANENGGNFGWSVTSAGDVNGDGYSDVAVGAYRVDNMPLDNRGKVFIYHGNATGVSTTPNTTLADATANNAGFGYSISTAGDVNGDGYSDLIVTADQFTDGASANEGRAYVYYGSAAGITTAALFIDGANAPSNRFGHDAACAGDVNNDGYSDVVVSAFLYTGNFASEGGIFVYHGSPTGLTNTPSAVRHDGDHAGSTFGTSVASAGDVNGDNYSDIIVGAWGFDGPNTNQGRAWVYYGSATGIAASPSVILNHPTNQASASFGGDVSTAGDVNGDGYSDVMVGAYGANDGASSGEGLVYIFYGSSTGLPLTANAILDDANQAGALFGDKVNCAGDINGDGFSDVMIGAASYDGDASNEGQGFVYYGSSTGLGATPVINLDGGTENGIGFTYGLSSAGDVNGDGYSDLIIGAPYVDDSHTNEGKAFVYHGSADGLSASPVNTPDDANQASAAFGISVATAGDVNGDGYSDVIIGAHLYDVGGNANEGRAFVYHGSATGLPSAPNSTFDDAEQAGAFFGISVACAGDVNGDGYSDVIIGAYGYNEGANTDEGRAFVYHGSAAGLSATPNSTPDDADQSSSGFGVSVAGAGDVNGDGYSDVIIGANAFDDGTNTDEGRAFVYHGSAAGLSATPNSTPNDADQVNAFFGISVATAGDVNGDGYSDIIIGANGFDDGANTDEGRAYVYHGSAIGLSTAPNSILDDADQSISFFGYSVASAGDVNGDGFTDVIIGAHIYDNDFTNEGRAFVYHGSSSGLSALPNITLDDANQDNAFFGRFVAGAGDVNGDGYSDVIIGADGYDEDGNTDEGVVFVYHGSVSGLSATPSNTPNDADQPNAQFGRSVAAAGDVNGDGYGDIIIGAWTYDGANTNEGRAFLYYGNNAGGLRNNLRLYNIDLVTPIRQSNIGEPNLFGAGLFAKSSIGRVKGRMTWEVMRQGIPFSGSPITNSTAFLGYQPFWTDLGTAGSELKYLVQKTGFQNKIRTRVQYDKATAITGQMYGPWRYPEGYLRGAYGMNSVPLPVTLLSFSGKQNTDKLIQLNWVVENETTIRHYEVLRSYDGISFTLTGRVNAINNNGTSTYTFIDNDVPQDKTFYRLRIVDINSNFKYSKIIKFSLKANVSISIYPNPAKTGQIITLSNPVWYNQKIKISITSADGKEIYRKELAVHSRSSRQLQLPYLPAGNYILICSDESNTITTGKIIIN